jgi:hypothetical protein
MSAAPTGPPRASRSPCAVGRSPVTQSNDMRVLLRPTSSSTPRHCGNSRRWWAHRRIRISPSRYGRVFNGVCNPRWRCCGDLRATGRPDKRRAPRLGSCRGGRPHNRFCVPIHEFRRFACGQLIRRPCRLRAAAEILRFADPRPPMAAGPRASSWRYSRKGRSRSSHRPAELHSFVGWLAIEIVNQGDGHLGGHLHHFLHADAGHQMCTRRTRIL